tara:strand:+ start:435 stop:542 length:108 start_codon:yes stop_codon:yes gene_type:complete
MKYTARPAIASTFVKRAKTKSSKETSLDLNDELFR